MARQVSNTFKTAIYAQQTSEVFIVLLTISHPNFAENIRISSDLTQDLPIAGVKGTISNSLEYIYLPFSIILPQDDDTGVSRASITIENVNNEIIDYIRQADSSLNIDFKIVLSSDPNVEEIIFEDFKLESVNYDANTISGDISIEYFELEPFPSRDFTPSDFPGIF